MTGIVCDTEESVRDEAPQVCMPVSHSNSQYVCR